MNQTLPNPAVSINSFPPIDGCQKRNPCKSCRVSRYAIVSSFSRGCISETTMRLGVNFLMITCDFGSTSHEEHLPDASHEQQSNLLRKFRSVRSHDYSQG